MPLTAKQEQFCFEYAKDQNATRAATVAGYSPKTAAAQASRLLRNVNVKAKIAQLLNKSVTKKQITLDDVIGELRIIMLADMLQFATWTATTVTMKPSGDLTQNALKAIESVQTTTAKDGTPQLRVKLHSKLKAAELLIRIFEIQETELRLVELEGNFVKFKQRIDRLSKSIDEIQFAQGGIRVCFQEAGQSEEEAMKAAGIEPDNDALTIFVMHWATKPVPGSPLCDRDASAPEPDSVADIDKKINELKDELIQDGVCGRQLAEIEANVKKGSQDPKQEKTHEPDSQPLDPQPMISDLTGIFNK